MSANKAILVKAKELIETVGWVQGTLGGPKTGYCLHGAIFYGAQEVNDKFGSVDEAGLASDNGYTSSWNDTKGRTKEEVIAALDDLIGKCPDETT